MRSSTLSSTAAQIVVHASDVERRAQPWPASGPTRLTSSLCSSPTPESRSSALNAAVRDRLVSAGRVDDLRAVTTTAGQRIGVGDRVATRQNDRDLDVANRETWTVIGQATDGGLVVDGHARPSDSSPPATSPSTSSSPTPAPPTAPKARPSPTAHVLVGDQTSAASAYVGMTRGRQTNTAHLVADSVDEAQRQWIDIFSRDRADLGPAHAAQAALKAMERDGISPPSSELALQRAALRGLLASPPRQTNSHELNPHRDVRTSSPGR